MKTTATFAAIVLVLCVVMPGFAQTKPTTPSATAPAPGPPAPAAAKPAAGVTPPADYVIGAGDVLTITYWRDKDMTGDYTVRPDGIITLPLINDIVAISLTTEQLRERLMQASAKMFVDPTITVGVKDINSRRVYINGGVQKPGPYLLLTPMTVAQLISVAGGFKEYVDTKKIRIVRENSGKQTLLLFNYKEFQEGKNLQQNIALKPGDTVLVPEPD